MGQQTSGDLDDLAHALARWLEAAHAPASSAETRQQALEEARLRLRTFLGRPPPQRWAPGGSRARG